MRPIEKLLARLQLALFAVLAVCGAVAVWLLGVL